MTEERARIRELTTTHLHSEQTASPAEGGQGGMKGVRAFYIPVKNKGIKKIILFCLCLSIFSPSLLSQTWTRIIPQFSTGDTNVDLSCSVFATKNTGWIVHNYYDSFTVFHSKIYKTTDGGHQWTLQLELIPKLSLESPRCNAIWQSKFL